jgi:hypothetical protein
VLREAGGPSLWDGVLERNQWLLRDHPGNRRRYLDFLRELGFDKNRLAAFERLAAT